MTSQTRQEARESVNATELRNLVLDAYKQAGANGLTADEAADECGESVLSIRPRVTELKTVGLLATNGKRRKNGSANWHCRCTSHRWPTAPIMPP